MPIVSEKRSHPYGDTPSPKCFGAVSPLDPELFSSINGFADELVAGKLSGKYSPLNVAKWLSEFCDTAESSLQQAQTEISDSDAPSFRRLAVDVVIQAGIGRFFAHKLRAGVAYALYERTSDVEALERAVSEYHLARSAWERIAEQAKDTYVNDLTFGLSSHLRGHWMDRLAAIDEDIQDMEAELEPLEEVQVDDNEKVKRSRAFLALSFEKPIEFYCEHTPPDLFQPGAPVKVEVTVEGIDNCSIYLHYRHVNQAEEYLVIEMQKRDGCYIATIPSDYTDSPYPLQYFLEFRDTQGRAWLYPSLNATLSNQPYYAIRQR
jgi:hypothetical protein